MPRCANCGRVNRDGSLFCQDCGQKLEAPPAASPARPAASAATGAGVVCASCSTVNPAGMNFCKSCGAGLTGRPMAAAPAAPARGTPVGRVGGGAARGGRAVPTPAATPAVAVSAASSAMGVGATVGAPAAGAAASAKVACPSCHKPTPSGFAFCQHCGTRLAQPQPAAPAAFAPTVAPAPAGVARVSPTPPAGMPPVASAPLPTGAGAPAAVASGGTAAEAASSAGASPDTTRGPSVRAGAMDETDPSAFAATLTPPVADSSRPLPVPPPARPSRPSVPAVGASATDERAAAHGRLVLLRRDGTDGESQAILGDSFDVGRVDGQLIFGGDPYLAPRHARFQWSGGALRVRALDGVNGIYLRLREPVELLPGDQLILGKELLRFEPLSVEERDPPSLVEHGVRLLGSVAREAWGRLRQLTSAGTTRDLWHLTRPEFVLGREEGDVTFPDDEFMSRRHAAVRRAGGRVRLEDMGSSNGTFLRLRGERELRDGDVLRMGDQLLRYEA